MNLNFELLPKNITFLVGVSGGRDSVGLLHRLIETRDQIGTFVVVHVNHGLRQEAFEESQFVERLAKKHQVPFILKVLKTPPKNETQARQLRYQALEQAAIECGASRIATAHHRQDQLETRLMNLLRGASPVGLLGMPVCRQLSKEHLLVRPALQCDAHWLHEAAPEWREDASNKIQNTARNKLRLEIIPRLQEVYPRDFMSSFESLSELLEDDLEALKSYVPEKNILSRDDFIALPRAIQSRWLRREAPLDKIQVDRGIQSVLSSSSLDLGQGIYLRVSKETVSIEKLVKIAQN